MMQQEQIATVRSLNLVSVKYQKWQSAGKKQFLNMVYLFDFKIVSYFTIKKLSF